MEELFAKHWDALVTFVVGGGAGKLLDKLIGWWKERRRTSVTAVFDAAGDMYSAMHQALEDTAADYVLVILIHNGGKLLHPGTPTFSTVVHEVISEEGITVKERWQARSVDAHYVAMVQKTLHEGRVVLQTGTADLPEETLLGGAYAQGGVAWTDTRLLDHSHHLVHLLVVGWKTEVNPDNPVLRAHVDDLQGALQRSLRQVSA